MMLYWTLAVVPKTVSLSGGLTVPIPTFPEGVMMNVLGFWFSPMKKLEVAAVALETPTYQSRFCAMSRRNSAFPSKFAEPPPMITSPATSSLWKPSSRSVSGTTFPIPTNPSLRTNAREVAELLVMFRADWVSSSVVPRTSSLEAGADVPTPMFCAFAVGASRKERINR